MICNRSMATCYTLQHEKRDEVVQWTQAVGVACRDMI